MLKENYEKVKENIVRACEKAGRSPEDVTLIAVSKTKPLSDIEELLSDTGSVILVRIRFRSLWTNTRMSQDL